MKIKTIFYQKQHLKKDLELEVYATLDNELSISINNPNNLLTQFSTICLDKKTAIKLVRVLRREISFIND